MKQINTANGPIDVEDLGNTLMHEHLTIAFPGTHTDTLRSGPTYRDMVAICVDQVAELRDGGYTSLVDPCPNDMGRSIELIGEVAARTGFNIVFATGLYNQAMGGNAYWLLKTKVDNDGVQKLADVFISELTDGVQGSGGLKAGLLKVGTSRGAITEYEQAVLRAAAIAAKETGAPITTHTDYQLGPDQVRFLKDCDVPADQVIVGHCCGNPDHAYHMEVIGEGAYIGFDQFGVTPVQPDEVRIASLMKIREAGRLDRVMVSHDSTWCMQGEPYDPAFWSSFSGAHTPMHFIRNVAPQLKEKGVTDAEIDLLIRQNPRRYFGKGAA
jgi:phosphotriesterase-related protein